MQRASDLAGIKQPGISAVKTKGKGIGLYKQTCTCVPGKLKGRAVESLLSPELLLVLDRWLQSSNVPQAHYFFSSEKRLCLFICLKLCIPLTSVLLLIPDLSYY